MRHDLPDHWTLELDAEWTRKDHQDGFIQFKSRRLEIWAVVYCEQPWDSEVAVRSFLSERDCCADESPIAFRLNSDGIAGSARLYHGSEGWSLLAVAAHLGRLVKLDFRLETKACLEAAVTIWHSLRHAPPAWVEQCARAEPPLASLREALGFGRNVRKAIREAVERQQAPEVIAVLLESSRSDVVHVRVASCDGFASLSDASPPVMSALRAMLADTSTEVRAWAADALLELGEPPESTVMPLVEALKSPEPPLPKGADRIRGACSFLAVPDRYHAARVLKSLGESARPAREALLEHLWDESGCVRLRVVEALLNIGEPLETVMPSLRDGLTNPDLADRERIGFAQPLVEQGESLDAVLPSVIRLLGDTTDFTAKSEALEVLGDWGAAASSAADCIEQVLRREAESEDGGEQLSAALALVRIGMRVELAWPVLLAELEGEPDSRLRVEIIEALGRLNSPDFPIRERLLVELAGQDVGARRAAAFALARHALVGEQSLAILRDALDAPKARTRWNAAVALGDLGPAAAATTDRLFQVARDDPSRSVRLAAIWSLGNVGLADQRRTEEFLAALAPGADEETAGMIRETLEHLSNPFDSSTSRDDVSENIGDTERGA